MQLAKSPFSPLCPCVERERRVENLYANGGHVKSQTLAPSVPVCLAPRVVPGIRGQGWDLVLRVALWVQDLHVLLSDQVEGDPEGRHRAPVLFQGLEMVMKMDAIVQEVARTHPSGSLPWLLRPVCSCRVSVDLELFIHRVITKG